ncbi:hypothetical protein GF325_08070 [Candidatus Bathyarchaeota archaeon]|nr:hypothetical protein [Candidatus Bathyarchaeota archaeon]
MRCSSMTKPKTFITTSVFKDIINHPRMGEDARNRIRDAWKALEEVSEVEIFEGRFPDEALIRKAILDPAVRFIGCHLSHEIKPEWLEQSNIIAVATSTMGYDHVGKVPGVLITHTPSVLQATVADYTMALILANLRNIISLHETVWNGEWEPGQKWDLDGNLSKALDGQVVGLIGLGEIGSEVARRLVPWNTKTLYFDIDRKPHLERDLGLIYESSIEMIFKEADVISLHVPLNDNTRGMFDKRYLSLMKPSSLLVNTARGGIINTGDLLDLLEADDIKVHLAFDVHETEPIDPDILQRFRKIKENNPDLRFVFTPHNASADVNTRGEMAAMLLEDLARIAGSTKPEDIEECRLIGRQRQDLKDGKMESYRIHGFWKKK